MKSIIEKLASKELSFGCRVKCEDRIRVIYAQKKRNQWWLCLVNDYEEKFKKYLVKADGGYGFGDGEGIINFSKKPEILGHPVYIGDVLAGCFRDVWSMARLIELWQPLDLSKSLQQIAEESGYWEKICDDPEDEGWSPTCAINHHSYHSELKDPRARELEQFISNLIL